MSKITTDELISEWQLMPPDQAVKAMEAYLRKTREEAAGDQSKEIREKIEAEIKKSNDLGEDYFPNADGLSKEDLRKKKIKDRTDKHFEPMD